MYWVEKFNNLCSGKTIKSIKEIDMHSANTCIEITFTDESKVTMEWDYMYDILFSSGNDKETIM
jgi:hypothetical protein